MVRPSTGKSGALSSGQGARDKRQQSARLLGEGHNLVVAVVRNGVPVSTTRAIQLRTSRVFDVAHVGICGA